jgi:predicted PurR-regulated permease PerM
MDQPAPSLADGPADADGRADVLARWVAALPAAPFVNATAGPGESRFVPLSPRVAVLIAAAIVAGLVLWMARDSIRPFILGLLFVYLLDPPVRWLARRGLRRTLAILVVYVVGIVLLIEFLALTLTPLVNELLRFIEDFPQLAAQLQEQLRRLGEFYQRLEIPVAIRDWIDGVIAGIGQGGGGGGGADLSFLLPLITGAGSLLAAIFAYFILPVWVAYILKDKVTLVATFDRSLPDAWRFDTWAVIKTVERDFGQWVRGQIILGFAVGIATFVGLIVLSQFFPIFGRYAVLLSVIAGLFELIPIIGPIISAVPAVLLAATVSPAAVVAALILYFLVQQVENNFLVPKIQGDAVKLHPAAVVFAIIVGASLAGLLGAILALPVTAAFRDVVRYLFRRLTPDQPEALAASLTPIGMGPGDG